MSNALCDRYYFEEVLADFVDEDPLACQGLLSVARVVFTTEVPTLAVTLRDDPPLLLVNPDFIGKHVQSEDDLRAMLLHEFLHVLLGHTKVFKKCDPATNLALDAVINHIVQRELGVQSGDFFRRFYTPAGDEDPVWLLRPQAHGDIQPKDKDMAHFAKTPYYTPQPSFAWTKAVVIHRIRAGLAEAKVMADDILDLFDSLDVVLPGEILFLGGHQGQDQDGMHPANRARLERLFKELDGSGIFRRPFDFGFGAEPYADERAAIEADRRWRGATGKILRRLLMPDPKSRPILAGVVPYCLPVATSADRRAALRSLWNPILPEFEWETHRMQPSGRVNIYLDVSGSMNEELNRLIGLLWQLRTWIRSPFNAFSNGVYPARIVAGKLKTETTGGTCFNDVLEHILKKRPGKSLIVTDGYIEKPDPELLRQLNANREEFHILVSSHGSREVFEGHSIPSTQLPRLQS